MRDFQKFAYRPGRKLEFIDGEWVITENGRIIARDLHIREKDVKRLKAAIIERLDSLDGSS